MPPTNIQAQVEPLKIAEDGSIVAPLEDVEFLHRWKPVSEATEKDEAESERTARASLTLETCKGNQTIMSPSGPSMRQLRLANLKRKTKPKTKKPQPKPTTQEEPPTKPYEAPVTCFDKVPNRKERKKT